MALISIKLNQCQALTAETISQRQDVQSAAIFNTTALSQSEDPNVTR